MGRYPPLEDFPQPSPKQKSSQRSGLSVMAEGEDAAAAHARDAVQQTPQLTVRQMLARAGASEDVPDSLTMDIFDLEAASTSIEDEWDQEDDGWLLECFTFLTGLCAGGYSMLHNQWLAFGVYLHNRRFWICKIIIVIMDFAMLRGAFSMGEEYCTQDDDISEFGWVIWSSFLVFCKFVYLRPVFHLHQLGVFHSSRVDAAKSACLEFLCMACHAGLLFSLVYRTFLRGYSAYRSGSCGARNRELITDIFYCQEAAEYYQLPAVLPLNGENRTKPLSRQPPGCYYVESEERLYFNPIICSESEWWCEDWVAQTYGGCTKDAACLCSCSFSSAAILLSVVVFTLPMPLQWRMLSSSIRRMREPPHPPPQPAPPPAAGGRGAAGEEEGEGGAGRGPGREGERMPRWEREVAPARYASAMEELKLDGLDGLWLTSALKQQEGAETNVGVGASNTRMRRLHKELSTLGPQLQQHPNSSVWIRYDSDKPQFMRAAITGPAGTPYESGVFLFDLYFPPSYPQVPPKMAFLTTARGTVRFSPNLYADGKVCLSLLGTFDGPRWGPGSSLYQVLVSIQGMILGVAHPLYNEPGLGGFETGREEGGEAAVHVCRPMVRRYDERTQLATLQHAVLAHLSRPPLGFQQLVARHFALKRGAVVAAMARWGREGDEYRRAHGRAGLAEDFGGRLRALALQVQLALELLPECPQPEGAAAEEAGAEPPEDLVEYEAADGREEAEWRLLGHGGASESSGMGAAGGGHRRGQEAGAGAAGGPRGGAGRETGAGRGRREVEMQEMQAGLREEEERRGLEGEDGPWHESDDDEAVAAGAGRRSRGVWWMGGGAQAREDGDRDDLSLLGRGRGGGGRGGG